MNTDKSDRLFVEQLLGWLRGDLDSKRKLTSPLPGSFVSSLHRLIEGYYYRRLRMIDGHTLAEFTGECTCRVMHWIRRNPSRLQQPEFNDDKLKGVVCTIIRNFRSDLIRSFATKRAEVYDESEDENEDEEGGQKIVDQRLHVTQNHDEIDGYPDSGAARKYLARLFRRFLRSIEHDPELRDLLLLFLCYGRRNLLSRYLWTFQTLCQSHKQLPPDFRDGLKSNFSDQPYREISELVRRLKRTFRNFVRDNLDERYPFLLQLN